VGLEVELTQLKSVNSIKVELTQFKVAQIIDQTNPIHATKATPT